MVKVKLSKQRIEGMNLFGKVDMQPEPTDVPDRRNLVELMTLSAVELLDRWFECDPLKATMSASGIIGTFLGPRSPGTAYVLLHHYMGEIDGAFRAWGLHKGGTGAISYAIANAARALQLTPDSFEARLAQAGIDAIRAGHTRYTPPAGLSSLRALIAEDAGRRRGVVAMSPTLRTPG